MKYGMVIDLQRCVGCGACAFACKAENNTRDRDAEDGQSFNWADFTMKTEGKFPDTTHWVMPVLCNHCSDAACVEACPVTPNKAMYKTPEGITMHDPSLCIGCRDCQSACPYSNDELDATSLDGATYSVISYNSRNKPVQPRWVDSSSAIAGATASGAATAAKAGVPVPAMNVFASQDVGPLRKPRIIEKCTFCAHRTLNGMQPACVEACPSQARIFGDLDDANSPVAKILHSKKTFVLKPEGGTRPNVYYVGKYSVRG
jgi:Fe-S-cluster-containing dehydrogenase component